MKLQIPPSAAGEFAKPLTAGSPPQVKVTSSDADVGGLSSAPSTPVACGRQSPGFLSTSTAHEQQNSKVQSPAYSDISDANDSAPSLEQEGGAMDVTAVGANLSGSSNDTLPTSSPLSSDASSRICVTKGHRDVSLPDLTPKPFYSQPPSLLPVVSASATTSPFDADPRKLLQQVSHKSGRTPLGGRNDVQSKPILPLSSSSSDQRMAVGHLHSGFPVDGKRDHLAKTRTQPNLTTGVGGATKLPPSSPAGKQHTDKPGISSNAPPPASSARPVGCVGPMHSTPNSAATSIGAKHERVLSVDPHSRLPPMLISDRDRSDGGELKSRDRSSENRQILVESVEMRSQMPSSAAGHYQALAGGRLPQQQMLMGSSDHMQSASMELDGDERSRLQKISAAASKEQRPRGEDGSRGSSRDIDVKSPYNRDGSSSRVKSPQCSTPKLPAAPRSRPAPGCST